MEYNLFAEIINQAKQNRKQVFLCGNGGSAANAIHIANDWMAVGVRATALTNLATITAIANDYGYEYIFSKQLDVYGNSGDVLVVLSGSGKSQNIIEAVLTAKDLGMYSYAITGGVRVLSLVTDSLQTAPNMQMSEQTQLEIGHHVADYIKTRTH